MDLLKQNNEINSLQCIINHNKKDDLADSFLQSLWYIRTKLQV